MHHMFFTSRFITHKIIFVKIFLYELLGISIPLGLGIDGYPTPQHEA